MRPSPSRSPPTRRRRRRIAELEALVEGTGPEDVQEELDAYEQARSALASTPNPEERCDPEAMAGWEGSRPAPERLTESKRWLQQAREGAMTREQLRRDTYIPGRETAPPDPTPEPEEDR